MTSPEGLVVTHLDSLVVVLKALSFALGAFITYLVFKAYRRTTSVSLQLLAFGFGLVTAGSLLAGIVDQLTVLNTGVAVVTQSALTAIGFSVILYSVYRK